MNFVGGEGYPVYEATHIAMSCHRYKHTCAFQKYPDDLASIFADPGSNPSSLAPRNPDTFGMRKYRLLHTQYRPQHEASQREILASSVTPEGYSSVAQEAAVDPLILREALIQAINILQMKTCVNIATARAHFAICTISGSRGARPPNSIFAFRIPSLGLLP